MSEKPIAFVIPSWDPNEPRFKVEECPKCGDDRKFKNGKCVYNQRLGFCYSVEEIVEVLNNTESEEKLDAIKKSIEDKIKVAEPLQIPFGKLHYGQDKGYYRGYVDVLKELLGELEE